MIVAGNRYRSRLSNNLNLNFHNLMGDHKDKCEGCTTHGPWGGSRGKDWFYKPNGFIRKIIIVHHGVVNGIKFYSGGSIIGETESSFFGGNNGKNVFETTDEIILQICIDYPNEYLTSISGRFEKGLEGLVVRKSLYFRTNQNQYGPYGGDNRVSNFSYKEEGVMIAGFHGRASATFLHAIGIYVMPTSCALGGLNSTSKDNSMHEAHPFLVPYVFPLCSEISRMSMPRDAGPWGASVGGKPWDDGVFFNVKKVHIHIGESLNVIYAIQFEYVESYDKSVLSPIHGGIGGDKMELANLDETDEYLIGISGFYGPIEGYNGLEAITSITFHTNKKKLGPYGEENGAGYTCFSSTAASGKVDGFHGRNDGFLKAIGVHMKYF